MKVYLLLFLFLGLISDNLNKAAQVNNQVSAAKQYYQAGQYQQAAALYKHLIDSLALPDPELRLNLAHALYLNGEYAQAKKLYTQLSKQPLPAFKSIAFTQLGHLYFRQENPERALYHFRKALTEDARNETARYNYELVKKYLDQNPGPIKKNKPKPTATTNTAAKTSETGNEGTTSDNTQQDKANQSQRSTPEKGGNAGKIGGNSAEQNPEVNTTDKGKKTPTGGPGNTKGINLDAENTDSEKTGQNKGGTNLISEQERQMQTLRARLRNTDLSPEKAAMLLEAMRQAELQYLLQVPKKTVKPTNPKTPDW